MSFKKFFIEGEPTRSVAVNTEFVVCVSGFDDSESVTVHLITGDTFDVVGKIGDFVPRRTGYRIRTRQDG